MLESARGRLAMNTKRCYHYLYCKPSKGTGLKDLLLLFVLCQSNKALYLLWNTLDESWISPASLTQPQESQEDSGGLAD